MPTRRFYGPLKEGERREMQEALARLADDSCPSCGEVDTRC
jgi:hypothetical protein